MHFTSLTRNGRFLLFRAKATAREVLLITCTSAPMPQSIPSSSGAVSTVRVCSIDADIPYDRPTTPKPPPRRAASP